jgi:RNA polymerase sigma-70 factor (ECF subfamily)
MAAIEVFIEDERSIRAGLLGDRAQELDHAVSRYLPIFHKRALRFLGNAHDAEDAVQDALLSAYKHLDQFRGQAKLSTWLTTIVTNAARMQLRRRGRVHLSLDQHFGEDDLAFSERLPDTKPGPEEICFSSGGHDWLVMASSNSHQSCAEHFSCETSTA